MRGKIGGKLEENSRKLTEDGEKLGLKMESFRENSIGELWKIGRLDMEKFFKSEKWWKIWFKVEKSWEICFKVGKSLQISV